MPYQVFGQSALWSTCFGRDNDVIEQNFCFQHLFDYHNQLSVLYPDSPQLPNELTVVDIIKETNNVYIYYKVQILQLCHFIALCDCILR